MYRVNNRLIRAIYPRLKQLLSEGGKRVQRTEERGECGVQLRQVSVAFGGGREENETQRDV